VAEWVWSVSVVCGVAGWGLNGRAGCDRVMAEVGVCGVVGCGSGL
jgi:hypothetical protein